MDTVQVAAHASAMSPFPKGVIEAKLLDELIEAVKMEASVKGLILPATPSQIAKAGLHVDSLVVVSILCVIEPIVGFELPESVVRAGGYESIESALVLLLPRIEKEWMKKKGAHT